MKATDPQHANNAKLAAEAFSTIPFSDIANTLFEALAATTTSRAGTKEADYRTRVAASQLLLHYKLGRPSEAPDLPKQEEAATRSVADLSDDALNGILATLSAEAKRRAGKGPL
jgi:hypothetical protein